MSLSCLDTKPFEYSLKPLLWSSRSSKISFPSIFPDHFPPSSSHYILATAVSFLCLQQIKTGFTSRGFSLLLLLPWCSSLWFFVLPIPSLRYQPCHAMHAHLPSPTALLVSFINPSPPKIPSYIHAFCFLFTPTCLFHKNVTFARTETVLVCLYHHGSPRFPVQSLA